MSRKSYKLLIASKYIGEYCNEVENNGVSKSVLNSAINEALLIDKKQCTTNMHDENHVHVDCNITRGMQFFTCLICGERGSNYAEGIEVCKKCCRKHSICCMCGDFGEIEKESTWNK